MSFKERMLDRMELHALSAYDNELCEALRRHLGTFAIEAREAMPGTPECMHRRVLMDHSRILISSLKVSGRSFGQVDVSQYTGGGHRGGTYTWYWFGYLVPRQVDKTLKEGVAVQLHLMKKGLLHRETVGHEWRGGALAGTLNQDQELMQAIAGLDRGSASLGISPAAAGFWITLHVMANEEEGYVGLWQPSRDPYVLPTELDLRIAERVTRHVEQFVP